ncbi:hypothetical protein BO85DRAFT_488273 [Aspergillus piperis CBS 112811]|uniref:Uncharacterized protein n=1 Tax=Aspergillus piperis CBS 112811 TaxID=1448313 RepID=A0A8G1VM92_9EURO|nr:hypothetical protein BO85DRAFT_488273 [Aspergillus piperis CBS 112811]RAH57545.1 hypothetical protein BO85DRAFT_488273 [Aspergillus piperis CBS 112811]
MTYAGQKKEILIAGLQTKRYLLPYQVYGAIWMLACEVTTYLRGGFWLMTLAMARLTLMTILTVLTLRWIEIVMQRACANPYTGLNDTLYGHDTDLPI